MTREEKIKLLEALRDGKPTDLLKQYLQGNPSKKIEFAINNCQVPIIEYMVAELGEEEQDLNLIIVFQNGVIACKNNDEILEFARSFNTTYGEIMRQRIEEVNSKMGKSPNLARR